MSELALRLIAENKITKAPFLDLGNCGLVNYLPEELLDCVWLTGLNLGDYYAEGVGFGISIESSNTLPSNIFFGKELYGLEKLTNLQELYLSSTEISNFQFLEKLLYLQILDLSFNKLSDIQFLQRLIGLQILDLSNNEIFDIQFLENLVGLQELYLSSNEISNFQFLEKLPDLQILELSFNNLYDIQFLENLVGLQRLYLNYNELSDIHFLAKLTGLQKLDLSSNKLSDIHFLAELTGLEILDLSFNDLSDFQFLENLVSLQILTLTCNNISSIHFLENLIGLQILELNFNQISDIQYLENLTDLQTLRLRSNQISDMNAVKKICFSTTITDVDFSDNPLPLPEGLDLSDISLLRSYFKDGEAGVTNKRSVKLLFMGDGCAGKSTLYQHLKTGVPPQEIAVNDRTHGIALDVWSGVLPDVAVRVWDFGGQDVFHSTHRLFLGQGAIYVVVWTKQANKKCTQGEQHPLRYWLDFIADYGKNSRVLLVENTIDGQFDSTEFPDDTTLEQLVEEYNEKGIYLDTSLHRIDCKYDTRKVKSLKKMLEGEIEQLVEDFPIKDFPANWYAVQQRLEQLKLVHKTIVWEDYQAICDQENISDATALVKYLDRSGVVSYYPDLFEQQVILQTDWILEAMYAFLQLENNPIARQGGKLREEDFQIVWGTRYTAEEQALFKSYMLKSEVMARPSANYGVNIQRDYEYLIPALFKRCKPHEKVQWANEPHYIAIQFKFIYLAIIQRLQVKILTHCHVEEEESFYNNRISFTDKGGRTAHIELLVEEKELRIHAGHQDLYRDILTELNSIYPLDRLKVIERIKGQEDKEMDSSNMQHGKEYGFEKKGFLNENIEETMQKEPIKVFVTYCWTDKDGNVDKGHQNKVESLVNALRGKGFDATFDKAINDTCTANDFMRMMAENIVNSEKIIIVLSEGYAIKANEFRGGVGDEYQMVLNDLKRYPNKYILATLSGKDKEIHPLALRGRDTIDLSKADLTNEIEKLIRKLHGTPAVKLAPIGERIDLSNPDILPPLF